MTQSFFADEAATEAAFQLPPDAIPVGAAFPEHQEPEKPAQSQQEAPEPVEETVPEFDARHKQPFRGLLYVGALTHTVEMFGHSFTIGTPTETERLQIGPIIQPYLNTVTAEIAYQTALVSAYLIQIDGEKLPEPVLNNPKETALHDRFTWVRDNVRRQVINRLFDECLKLDTQVDEVLEAMGKASG